LAAQESLQHFSFVTFSELGEGYLPVVDVIEFDRLRDLQLFLVV